MRDQIALNEAASALNKAEALLEDATELAKIGAIDRERAYVKVKVALGYIRLAEVKQQRSS